MPTSNSDLIIFNPQQVAQQSIQVAEQRRGSDDKGVLCGYDPLDSDMNPFIPGDLGVVIARPSNYKTSFMLHMAAKEAENIVAKELEEIVVYITWEIAVEEAGIMELSAISGVDMKWIARGMVDDNNMLKLQSAALERANVPIWVIGHSLLNRRKRPGMTMTDVANAMKYVEDNYHKKIRLICIDYLQQISPEDKDGYDKVTQVSSAVYRSKDMALAMGCPVILGCQAKREVDERRFKLPGMADGMNTSAIEHAGDKIISLWMPHVSHDATIKEFDGYAVDERTLVVGLVKQRYGKSQKMYLSTVNFRTRDIFAVPGY